MESEVFFTYFPHGMQDKVFERKETNVAENLIEKAKKDFGNKILIFLPDIGVQRRTKILGFKKEAKFF